MPPKTASDALRAQDRELLTELNALHARALRRMPWIQIALMVALSFVVYGSIPVWAYGVWALIAIAIETLRAHYANSILSRGDSFDPQRVHGWLIALAALSGASMGIGSALVLPHLPILDQALLGIFVFVMPAAGAAVSQSSRYIVMVYSLTILLLPSATWIALHPSQALAVGAGTTIFLVLMVLVAADGDKLLRRSVLIRHQRDRLVQDLEQKNAEVQIAMAKAEASALARARVLAAASHDLRQPLHTLSVYSAVLTAQPEPAVLAEVGHHIVEIVRSLGSVLNGLLDLSRLSSGYYVPDQALFALDKILAPVCAEFGLAARQKGLALQVELGPASVRSDPVALSRIARNLIDNAIKYTEQGWVRVSTFTRPDASGPVAVLRVSDSGKGIAVEDQERVFEEFYQVGNPGRDRALGVGLGLAIVQRLCELLNGRIALESRLGAGSSFEVQLPATEIGEHVPAVSAAASPPVELTNKKVYVVDDEADVLRATQSLLELWGLRVQCAANAAAAWSLCEQHGKPDLMIVDLRLGENEHGAALAARLQQAFGAFPVLVISGETASTAIEEASEQHYQLLHKPVAPEVFHAAVAQALSTSGAEANRPSSALVSRQGSAPPG